MLASILGTQPVPPEEASGSQSAISITGHTGGILNTNSARWDLAIGYGLRGLLYSWQRNKIS